MNSSLPTFREPTAVEKLFNRTFGFLVGLGLGPSHIYLLQVRRTQIRQALLHSRRSTGTAGQTLSGRTARANAVDPQRRSRRRNNVEEGKHEPEISSASNPGCREAGDLESLSRLVQARSATILSNSGRVAARTFRRDRRRLSRVRTSRRLIGCIRIAENILKLILFFLCW